MNAIDFERTLKAPFRDAEWITKALLGLVFVVLGVTFPAVVGAGLEYIKKVRRGDDTLPDWSDFGTQWIRGLLVLLGAFVYSLPMILLAFVFVIPVAFAAIFGSGDAAGAFGLVLLLLYIFLATIYGILLSVFYLAAVTHYAMEDRFTALFEVRQIWRKIRWDNSYWVAWLFTLAISILGSVLNTALAATVIGILLIPAVAYLQVMMTAHLFGQWAGVVYPLEPAPAATAAADGTVPVATAPAVAAPGVVDGQVTPAAAAAERPSDIGGEPVIAGPLEKPLEGAGESAAESAARSPAEESPEDPAQEPPQESQQEPAQEPAQGHEVEPTEEPPGEAGEDPGDEPPEEPREDPTQNPAAP